MYTQNKRNPIWPYESLIKETLKQEVLLDREKYFIMMKLSIQQKDMTILNSSAQLYWEMLNTWTSETDL